MGVWRNGRWAQADRDYQRRSWEQQVHARHQASTQRCCGPGCCVGMLCLCTYMAVLTSVEACPSTISKGSVSSNGPTWREHCKECNVWTYYLYSVCAAEREKEKAREREGEREYVWVQWLQVYRNISRSHFISFSICQKSPTQEVFCNRAFVIYSETHLMGCEMATID